MLRNRTRAVTSKQSLMADHSSQQSQSQSKTQNYSSTKPIPSFFGSPRFKAFTTKGLITTTETTDHQASSIKSPTSILDNNKPFFPFTNYPLSYDIINQPKSPKLFSPNNDHTNNTPDSKPIGLALVDTLQDKQQLQPTDHQDKKSCCRQSTSNKMVLFGTELRVQIPPPLPVPPPCLLSPTDFGIKTKTASTTPPNYSHPRVFTGCTVPVKEMELSEDYTCIISRGPNPKTTHIFDNCVVESYSRTVTDHKPKSSPRNNEMISFLSFCHTCNKSLQQKIDIYIYRGEKAFCSQECRYQEMLLDAEEN